MIPTKVDMATVWDQIVEWAPFAANLATIAAVFFLIQQIRLERSRRDEERTERKKQLERQRDTVLWSLRAEISAIRMAVEMDLKEFQPSDMSIPRVKKAAQDMQAEQAIGEMAYYRSFAWTSLPTSTIEQALREADLLGLTAVNVKGLQGLRIRILKANSLVPAKTAVLPILLAGGEPYQAQPGLQLNPYRWVDIKADRFNENIRNEFTGILNECNEITEWLNAPLLLDRISQISPTGRRKPRRTGLNRLIDMFWRLRNRGITPLP